MVLGECFGELTKELELTVIMILGDPISVFILSLFLVCIFYVTRLVSNYSILYKMEEDHDYTPSEEGITS